MYFNSDLSPHITAPLQPIHMDNVAIQYLHQIRTVVNWTIVLMMTHNINSPPRLCSAQLFPINIREKLSLILHPLEDH